MKLGELGEFGLIERIAARVAPQRSVKRGIGDDAAVIEPTAKRQTLLSTDMLVEGVHFDLSYGDPVLLGRKALAVNISDIAAMGGESRQFLLGLAIPRSMPVEVIDGFLDGLLGMAAEHDLALIGGDTCASPGGLVISVTIIGEQQGELVVTRSGALPGDLVCVTGTLGDAALGLKLLQQGVTQGMAVKRQLDPRPRAREGVALASAGLASAMIDLSDGLLADLGHILEKSRVGGRLELDKLPVSAELRQAVGIHAIDPYELALAGGEDYELLFTVTPGRLAEATAALQACDAGCTVIGVIDDSKVLKIFTAEGKEYLPKDRGYDHFTPAD